MSLVWTPRTFCAVRTVRRGEGGGGSFCVSVAALEGRWMQAVRVVGVMMVGVVTGVSEVV